MTLAHAPGSLSLLSKAFGTLRGRNIGTFVASRLYGGTYLASASGGAYGSFGTLAGRVHRVNLGSVSGSVSAHRAMLGAFPGTVRQRTAGTMPHTYFAAPAQPRYVNVAFNAVPTVSNPMIAVLRQSAGGTVAQAGISADATQSRHAELAGWVLPGRGSYVIGTGVAVGASFTVRSWREWDP